VSLLDVQAIDSFYDDLQALFSVDVTVDEGTVVAIIGANGSGKSTLLRVIAGLQPARSGHVRYDGILLANLPAHERVARGIALVPEGRRIFPSLSVLENLKVGAYRRRPGPWALDPVVDLFPLLRPLLARNAAVLSGGEQQALAIGRALMGNPRLLLLDEVSLGLAPTIVRQLYAGLPAIVGAGTTILLVEQSIGQAMAAASRIYCLLEGRVALAGAPASLTRDAVSAAYFGV
jgi:branched-chain amino acid transport system ATP-binding protein